MESAFEESFELVEIEELEKGYYYKTIEKQRRDIRNKMDSRDYIKSCSVENKKFTIGSRVKITNSFVDFQFFKLGETGRVIKNSENYLGIIVLLDNPHYFTEGDDVLVYWGFNYDDLIFLKEEKLPEEINKLLDSGQLERPYWKEKDMVNQSW